MCFFGISRFYPVLLLAGITVVMAVVGTFAMVALGSLVNDLDRYEGRYGIEDTRQAIIEARAQGLQPFCVTIDARGNDYLPYLFGRRGYAVIHRPSQLPRTLPVLYSRLTAA